MKNFKHLFKLSTLGLAVIISSCEKEENATVVNDNPEVPSTEVSQSVIEKLDALSFNTDDVSLVDFMLPDGTTEERYKVENDIYLTKSYVETMELNGGVQSEQYRTRNLVRQNSTIRVLGYTGGQFALDQAGRTGLQWAVNNYNRLDISLSMTLEFGSTNLDAYDIVIYDNSANVNGSGGVAGFPEGGRPHKFIQIYNLRSTRLTALQLNNINEEVITHEIGHAIGLRHTDWADRASCNNSSRGPEGRGSDGAIYIPGTNRGFDPLSIMLACGGSGESTGEFSRDDIIALEYLY